MHSTWLRNASCVTFVALCAMGASLAPASAHYATTRCDSDGDRCYRVVCDDDGDNCRRASPYQNYDYNRHGYDRGYSSRYGSSYGYGSGNSFGLYFNGSSDGWHNNNAYGRYENEEEESEGE